MRIQPAMPSVAPWSSVPRLSAPASAPVAPQSASFDRIFDFPGLGSGNRFKIVGGSTANGFPVRGDARLDELTPTSAKVWIKAGRFGFSKEANLSIAQTSPTTAAIVAAEPGKPPVTGNAQILDVRTNYSRFTSADPNINGGAELQINDQGQFVVDVKGDGRGVFANVDLHLVLEKV